MKKKRGHLPLFFYACFISPFSSPQKKMLGSLTGAKHSYCMKKKILVHTRLDQLNGRANGLQFFFEFLSLGFRHGLFYHHGKLTASQTSGITQV